MPHHDVVCKPEEWTKAYLILKRKSTLEKPPERKTMIFIIAGFGGFLGRKSDGFPGVQTLWIGLHRVRGFVIALKVQKDVLGLVDI